MKLKIWILLRMAKTESYRQKDERNCKEDETAPTSQTENTGSTSAEDGAGCSTKERMEE
jgi:hypothetical protein